MLRKLYFYDLWMVLFIVCHHLVYLSPDFVLRMPSFSHAEAGFMITDEAATRLSSHSVARHRYTVLIDDVDIKEASERMRVLYSCGSELGVKEWHRRYEIRLIAGRQVTLYEAAFFGSEGFVWRPLRRAPQRATDGYVSRFLARQQSDTPVFFPSYQPAAVAA